MLLRELYANNCEGAEYLPDFNAQIESNYKTMLSQDALAKKNDVLVGRILAHPYADGYAYYQVVKVNRGRATIKSCLEIGDDWVLPAWGYEANIPADTVSNFFFYKEGHFHGRYEGLYK